MTSTPKITHINTKLTHLRWQINKYNDTLIKTQNKPQNDTLKWNLFIKWQHKSGIYSFSLCHISGVIVRVIMCVSLFVYLGVWVCVIVCVSLCQYACVSVCQCVCWCVFACVIVCVGVCVRMSVCYCGSVCVWVSLCMHAIVYVCARHWPFLCNWMFWMLCVSLCMHAIVYVCARHWICLCAKKDWKRIDIPLKISSIGMVPKAKISKHGQSYVIKLINILN